MIIEPSWSVFGPCPRCGAPDGTPCWNMRATGMNRISLAMRNPHPGRKKVRN